MSKTHRVYNLSDILKRFDELPRYPDGTLTSQPLNSFIDEYSALDQESIEEIQRSVRQEDLDKLSELLHEQGMDSIYFHDWAAKFLALFARKKELQLLIQVLSKRDDYTATTREEITRGLIANSNIDTTTLLQLLSDIIHEDLSFYNNRVLEIREDSIKLRDSIPDIGWVLKDATLKLRKISVDEKKENYISKQKDTLLRVFDEIVELPMPNPSCAVEDIARFKWVSEKDWIQSTYDIAIILEKIGENKMVLSRIKSDLADFFTPFIPGRITSLTEPRRKLAIKLGGYFGDPEIALELMRILERNEPLTQTEYEEEILIALGNIGKRYSDSDVLMKLIEPLTSRMLKWTRSASEYESTFFRTDVDNSIMSLRYLRALEHIQGEGRTAKILASKAINSGEEEERKLFAKVLGGIIDKQSAFAELKRFFFEGTTDQRARSQDVMSEMGFAEAVKLLVAESNKELYTKYVGDPIKDLEERSKNLLESTVQEVKHGYNTINRMGIVVFVVGITVIAIGAIIALIGHNDPYQLIAGGGSVLAGLATVLVNFARGPVKIVQRALANLVQIETAFLGYIRRTGLASFVFLREYIQKKEEPNIEIFRTSTNEMKDAVTDTMALIELYSSESEELKDAMMKNQKKFLDNVLRNPSPEKAKEN